MAILIKPKNIYEIDNDKVVGNQIDKVEYSQNNINVENYPIEVNNVICQDWLESGYISFFDTTFPKNASDKFIVENQYNLTAFDSNTGYAYTRSGANGYIKINNSNKNLYTNIKIQEQMNYIKSVDVDSPFVADGVISSSSRTAIFLGMVIDYSTFKTLVGNARDIKNTKNYYCIIKKDDNNFELCYDICTYFTITKGEGDFDNSYIKNYNINIYIDQIPTETENISNGTGANVYEMSTNEVIQNNTKINGVTVGENLSNHILSEYANGKETATLLCEIGEYYNENGELEISIKDTEKPMVFEIGQSVIPYVPSVNGEEPMSRYSNGDPKKFIITGIQFIEDGAVWQKLTL